MKIVKAQPGKDGTLASVPDGVPFKLESVAWEDALRMKVSSSHLKATDGYAHVVRLDSGSVTYVPLTTQVTLYPNACVYEVEPKPNG